MRTIKFRAWHKKRKKFYKVLHLHLETIMNGGIWASCAGKDCIEQKDIQIQIQPEDCIIEQFTGLIDQNGVEIFDGDIMRDAEDENEDAYSVYWCDQSAQWKTHCDESENCSMFETTGDLVEFAPFDIVIGNIHADAHLLEK